MLIGFLVGRFSSSTPTEEGPIARKEIVYHPPRRINYSREFSDMNPAHLANAKRLGVGVPPTRGDVDKSRLKRITSNKLYDVDKLDYSIPYLSKGAAKGLEMIAEAFRDSLWSKNLPDYKLIVTSVLRTKEDVDRLRKSGNPNASCNSAHCHGTTFDITYVRYARGRESHEYLEPYSLTMVLAEVLRDQRNAGNCLVKYERKQNCFHITSLVK